MKHIIVSLAVILFVLSLSFPPWVFSVAYHPDTISSMRYSLDVYNGYCFILSGPPEFGYGLTGKNHRVYWPMLYREWGILAICTGVMLYLARTKRTR